MMRIDVGGWLLVVLAMSGCGAPSSSAGSVSPAASAMPATSPIPPASTAAAATTPSAEAADSTDRCEGVVIGCGAWTGCARVRPDPATPDRYIGVGESAGHVYGVQPNCSGDSCHEVCSGGFEDRCRAGIFEVVDVTCSTARGPTHAPFTCTMVADRCVQGPDPATAPAS